MSDLTAFRDHCRAMSKAEHKPECAYRPDSWLYARRPDPNCDGCNSPADRALFARLAAEVEDYLEPHPTLLGDDDTSAKAPETREVAAEDDARAEVGNYTDGIRQGAQTGAQAMGDA